MAPLPKKRHSVSNQDEEKVNLRKFQGKESFLTSQISLFVEESKPNIPDGGWGWFVVFSAFTLNAISEGVTFTFGLLYIEFLNEFGASKSATSWIGSLFMAVPLIAGPFASALVDKYGCKWMTIAGGLLTVVGFIASAYAESIGVMYFTFGVLGGLGRGLTYVTAVVAVAFWFDKRRSLGLGLAASGVGVGTVIFAPLSNYLLFEYRWRGTLIIIAAIFANMCVCGFLMRDPDWLIEEEKTQNTPKKSSKNASKDLLKVHFAMNSIDPNHTEEHTDDHRFSSMINLPTFLKHQEKVPLEVLKQLSENKQLYDYISKHNPKLLTARSVSDTSLNSSGHDSKVVQKPPHRSKETDDLPLIDEDGELENGAVSNKETPLLSDHPTHKVKSKAYAHSYLTNLRMRRDSVGYKGALLNIHKYKLKASSCPDVYRGILVATDEKEEKWYDFFFNIVKELSHFTLFLELHFLLLSLSTINLFIWFIVPYFYLAEHMIRIGYTDTQASFILSVIGFTNTVGMVVLGWVGDRYSVAKTYAICLILCGISVISMMYFTHNYTLLVINCALFGLFFASCFSLSPSLLAQLVPLDDFTLAYGLGLLNEGIGNLTGPPLAGWLFDITQSWEQSFYQAGFWIIISGVMIGTIPYTKNRRLIGSGPMLNDHQKKEASPNV